MKKQIYKDVNGEIIEKGDSVNIIWSVVGKVREVDGVLGVYDKKFNNFFQISTTTLSKQWLVIKVDKEIPNKELITKVRDMKSIK